MKSLKHTVIVQHENRTESQKLKFFLTFRCKLLLIQLITFKSFQRTLSNHNFSVMETGHILNEQ